MKAEGDAFLSADLIGKIAAGSLKTGIYFGCEVDTEWAVKDGRLYWLQARPITVTGEPDAFELDAEGDGPESIFTTCNVGEMLPGAVTPLSISTSVASIDFGMRKMIVKSGSAASMDDLPPEAAWPISGTICLSTSGRCMPSAINVVGATREGVELSLCGRILEDIPKPPVIEIGKFKKINNACKYFGILLGISRACKKLDKLSETACVPLSDSARTADPRYIRPGCIGLMRHFGCIISRPLIPDR